MLAMTALITLLSAFFLSAPVQLQARENFLLWTTETPSILGNAVSTNVVISQVYGGGGNAGSVYKNDFIELFNLGTSAQNLSGWSVQYASATGTSWTVTTLTNVTLQPGQYYLVQEAMGTGGTTNLPTPDTIGTIAMSATAGKVALVNNTTALSGAVTTGTGAGIVDFIGFGATANGFEGTAPAPAPSNTNGDLRMGSGCSDTDANNTDFSAVAPIPRNTASAINPCTAATPTPTPTPTVTPTPTPTPSPTPTITPTPTPSLGSAQPLPFAQDWSNTSLISTDNNWSNVPGIVGYRGDDLTTAIGTDPQTILADGSSTPVAVIANQTNPDTFTSGGIAEFELSNPVVAFQGSGTADAPHLVLNLDATGKTNVTISYNLRDIDGSTDNAVQPVALQYRIGSTGNYTNIPGGFVADASSGPGLATLVTPVNAALPAEVNNQTLVQVRIITANALGNDELIGIDDILVTTGGSIPLSASGSASTGQVGAGSSVLLKVSVNPATNPNSSGVTVTGNLSSIGGAAAQNFFDDGTNGDTAANDNTFSYLALIPANSSGGSRSVPISISDAQSRQATTSISLTITAAADPLEHLILGNPSGATTDVNNPFNYLLLKPQYAVSYHRDRAIPNWVSWHLDASWLGSASRQDDFRPDDTLPADWYHVTQFDYSGSGFDRGHHTPSADRTRTIADNSATFLMTNMMPQAPGNNQGPWEKLESDSRAIVNQGNELYIVAGSVGAGGVGSNGGVTYTLAGGKITVPSYTWKVILVLPNDSSGASDVSRVNNNTRVIAVIMPNIDSIRPDAWQKYVTTVDQVETLTGYDFFSNVSPAIQAVIESRVDGSSTAKSKAKYDFDGDGKSDISLYRPEEGRWYLLASNSPYSGVRFGLSSDKIVPADYDGDGRTDIAVFRDGVWYILQSSNGAVRYERFGQAGDLPRPGDFNGDGQADIAVFRPSDGTWYRLAIGGGYNALRFGQAGDAPMLGDYDGDGKSDYTVYRPSEGVWYTFRSSDSTVKIDRFGLAEDIPVDGDFNGDGKADLAVYRPSERTWYIARATGVPAFNFEAVVFGLSTDTPVAADYDGDGRTDIAVYRPSEGNWYRLRSRDGFDVVRFGLSGDKPVPSAFNR